MKRVKNHMGVGWRSLHMNVLVDCTRQRQRWQKGWGDGMKDH